MPSVPSVVMEEDEFTTEAEQTITTNKNFLMQRGSI